MSSSSRSPSPLPPVIEGSSGSPESAAPALAPPHAVAAAAAATVTVPAGANSNPSPIGPPHPTTTPSESQDVLSPNRDHDREELLRKAHNPSDVSVCPDKELGRMTPPPLSLPQPPPASPPSSHTRTMSKEETEAGLKLKPKPETETDEPDSPSVPSVIDISGPVRDGPPEPSEDESGHRRTEGADHKVRDEDGESEEEGEEEGRGIGMDTELTIHVDGGPDEAPPRASDATAADARAHTDAGSTLYGSFAAAGEPVHEHPLSLGLDVHAAPHRRRRRRKGDEEEGEYEEDEDEDDDDGEYEEDDLGMGMGMGMGMGGGGMRGRESPRGFVLTGGGKGGGMPMQMQEYGSKPSHGRPRIPHSAYYFGPPPPDSAYGSDPVGQIGVHHPREIVRVERDYSGGELPQFAPTYPLELEGRITPTQFLETINAINELLISAHSLGYAFVDNALAYFTLQISRAVKKTHYEKEMDRLKELIDALNVEMYNPVGLHIKWPRDAAFLFLEIEYY